MTFHNEVDIPEVTTLKQAVEWVAFGLIPQWHNKDAFPPDEARIWLRTKNPDGELAASIIDAQRRIFLQLKDGKLPATSGAIDEIERDPRYDRDTPSFRWIKRHSDSFNEIAPEHWNYECIFWSDSSLTYRHPDRSVSDERDMLATLILVETKRLFELFPKTEPGINVKTHSGDPGRPSSAHLYEQEFERLISEGKLEVSLAAQCRVLQRWVVSNHPDIRPPTLGTVENKIRNKYRTAKNPTKL